MPDLHKTILAVIAAVALSVLPACAAQITVFAAASLTDALTDIGKTYRAKTGNDAVFAFASSSTLARQIEAGAPAQIFVSADEQWMNDVDAHGLVEPGTRLEPLGNALVLIAPSGSRLAPMAINRGLDWLKLLGADGRLSVGDPDHVPAGIYAKEALIKLGAWTTMESRLARAEDVRGALALVERGECPLGIVYATDASASAKVKVVGQFPPDTHSSIVYPFAILKGQASPDVRAFFAYLTGPEAMAIFRRYGFAEH